MAAKRKNGDSPERVEKASPRYREHRILSRKHAESGKAAKAAAPPPGKPPGKKKQKDLPLTKTTETGGPDGPEPTRYGDWERKGRCVDF